MILNFWYIKIAEPFQTACVKHIASLPQGIQSQSQAEFDLRRTRVTGSTTSQGTTVELFGPAAFSIRLLLPEDRLT